MNNIPQRLSKVRERIGALAEKYGRKPDSITLLAVSKAQPAAAVRTAAALRQADFGENYTQEALQKMGNLTDLPLIWHFIGPVQSNKTRDIAGRFAWVHSLDRLKIAQRLDAARPDRLDPLNVCIQVNISGESTKAGINPDAVPAFARDLAGFPRLQLRGLMAMPAPSADLEQQRRPFRELRALLKELKNDGIEADTLSMGTSGDLEAAIAEGATIVRVGTAIFGPRAK